MDQHTLALLIPISAIVLGIGVAMLAIWTDYRKKREFMGMHHRERMAAIEKGMEIPPLPAALLGDDDKRRAPEDRLRQGLVLLFIGVALCIALSVTQGARQGVWGLLPAGIGLAQIIFYYADPRRRRPEPGSQAGDRNRES